MHLTWCRDISLTISPTLRTLVLTVVDCRPVSTIGLGCGGTRGSYKQSGSVRNIQQSCHNSHHDDNTITKYLPQTFGFRAKLVSYSHL